MYISPLVLVLICKYCKILCGYVICVVPSGPVNFVNVSRTATSVSFSWNSPSDVNGILQDYKVIILLCNTLHAGTAYAMAVLSIHLSIYLSH